MNPFKILREMARNAVVGGVADGLRDVAGSEIDPPADLSALVGRLEAARALPAAKDEPAPGPKPRKQRKTGDDATPAAESVPAATTDMAAAAAV